MTAGTPPEPVVKEGVSLPSGVLDGDGVVAGGGVGVGDDDALTLADGTGCGETVKINPSEVGSTLTTRELIHSARACRLR